MRCILGMIEEPGGRRFKPVSAILTQEALRSSTLGRFVTLYRVEIIDAAAGVELPFIPTHANLRLQNDDERLARGEKCDAYLYVLLENDAEPTFEGLRNHARCQIRRISEPI